MKSAKFAATAVMLMAFTSAEAGFSDGFSADKSGSFEGFYSNGYHYSVEIEKNGDDTYSMTYGDSQGALNITSCTATARKDGARLVLTTPKSCVDIEIDAQSGNETVTRRYDEPDTLVYEITADGLREVRQDNSGEVTELSRAIKAGN